MSPCVRGLSAGAALIVSFLLVVPPAQGKVPVIWATRRHLSGCEPPSVFYSSKHVIGRKPCCASIEGICPSGAACPVSGICSDGQPCVHGPVTDRPNVILFISD